MGERKVGRRATTRESHVNNVLIRMRPERWLIVDFAKASGSYVDDVDVFFKMALAAGAKERKPVMDQFYGDRSGQLEDPFGHLWWVATLCGQSGHTIAAVRGAAEGLRRTAAGARPAA